MFLIPIFVMLVIHIACILIVQNDYRVYSRDLRLKEIELGLLIGCVVAIFISTVWLLIGVLK